MAYNILLHFTLFVILHTRSIVAIESDETNRKYQDSIRFRNRMSTIRKIITLKSIERLSKNTKPLSKLLKNQNAKWVSFA